MMERESRGPGSGLWERWRTSALEETRPGGGRRRVSREEKARMVAECCRPGASVEVVARRHGVWRQRLHHWIRVAGRAGEVERAGVEPVPAYVRLVVEEGAQRRGGGGGRRGCSAAGCGWRGPSDEEGWGGLYEKLAEDDPSLPPRVVLASRRVSFLKGHDGLAAVVEQELGLDPYSGVAVVFRGWGHADEVKVLWWDGRSLVLAHKRLEHGRFRWPVAHHGAMHLTRSQFELLFEGLDWRGMVDPLVVRTAQVV